MRGLKGWRGLRGLRGLKGLMGLMGLRGLRGWRGLMRWTWMQLVHYSRHQVWRFFWLSGLDLKGLKRKGWGLMRL
ncbi:MAG: hypothetical protein J0M29_09070 [Chitinophagales bacterium]|nr:hypothetical protein [Chitinophagales bacterium]